MDSGWGLAVPLGGLAAAALRLPLAPQGLLHLLAEIRLPSEGFAFKQCLKSVPDGAVHRGISSLRDYPPPLASDGGGLTGNFPV